MTMSADVDQEIYDDCVSVTKPKPPIMQKPAVKNIAAMFGGAANNGSHPKKPVAVVQPSQTDKDAQRRTSGTPKQFNKPTENVSKPVAFNKPTFNGHNELKSVNNNTSSENSRHSFKTGGKISIPSAFDKPEEKRSSKLTDALSGLRPVGGINSSNKNNETKTSPTGISSKKIPPSVSPKSPVSKTNLLQIQKNNTIDSSAEKKLPTVPPKSPTAPPKSPTVPPKSPTVPPKSPVAKPMGYAPVKSVSKTQPQAVSTASKPVLMSCDNVKYCLKNKPKVFGKPPNKPAKMDDVNLAPVSASRPPDLPRRPPPKAADSEQTTKKNSIIREYTEEEEEADISGGHFEQETYDDASLAVPQLPARTFTQKLSPSTKSPNSSSSFKSPSSDTTSVSISDGETYDDCIAQESVPIEGTFDDIYEDVGEVQKNAAIIAKKEEDKRKEQERKEKKEREKQEKEEKERQRKLEKERKKFKITGDEVALSEGRVIKDSKGSKLDLPVKSGEMVSIIRMTDNPALKWLAQLSIGKVGYVEISNIEVDTQGIRHIMKESLENVKNASLKTANTASGVFEEVYDDVDVVNYDDQDIYEETG